MDTLEIHAELDRLHSALAADHHFVHASECLLLKAELLDMEDRRSLLDTVAMQLENGGLFLWRDDITALRAGASAIAPLRPL